MICKEFDELTSLEKVRYIGLLCHGVQSDSHLFTIGQEIIRLAERKGLLEDVIIAPETKPNEP